MEVSMENIGEDNMPIDFKTVSDLIDDVDHAVLLKKNDPLVEELQIFKDVEGRSSGPYHITEDGVLGDAWIFPGEDPTCEYLVEWMAERLYDAHENIEYVEVSAAETDKYHMTGSYPSV